MTDQDGPRFGLWYDFRVPDAGQPLTAFYPQLLDQIAWVERLGLDSVWLTEHHFIDTGFSSSPLVLAGAITQRTSTLRVGTNLVIAPLHNPVRLAEDAATVSLLSGGRFDLGVGQGYHVAEFDGFGQRLVNRPSLLTESVEVIRRAWAGSSEPYQGKRHRLPGVRVSPVPEQAPRLLIGALSEPAIERAARIGDGYLSTQNTHHAAYLDAWQRLGKPLDEARIYAGQWAIIAEDPERTWSRIGGCALEQLNQYIGWGAFGPPDQVPRFSSPDELLATGSYVLWDGDTAVRELTTLLSETPQIKDVHFWAQLPGEPLDSGAERIEYLAKHIVPAVRHKLGRG